MHTDRIPVSPPYAECSDDYLAQSTRVPAALAVGDIVMLNSGGPLMTVVEVRDDTVDCLYFDGNKSMCVNGINHKAVLPLASHR